MDKKLDNIVSQLLKVSEEVLRKYIPILNKVYNQNDYYLALLRGGFNEEVNKIRTDGDVLDKFHQICFDDLVQEATDIKNGVGELYNAIYNHVTYEDVQDSEDYPYLLKVWHGEIYDAKGIKALEKFIEDMVALRDTGSIDKCVNKTIKYFNSL